jgi:hypothetical protein
MPITIIFLVEDFIWFVPRSFTKIFSVLNLGFVNLEIDRFWDFLTGLKFDWGFHLFSLIDPNAS